MTILTGIKYGAILAALGVVFWLGGLPYKSKLATYQLNISNSVAAALQAQATEQVKKETAYNAEIADLQGRVLTEYPTVPIRLCPSANTMPPAAKGGQVLHPPAGVGAGNAVEVLAVDGPDDGPIVFGLADAFDALAAKCRND